MIKGLACFLLLPLLLPVDQNLPAAAPGLQDDTAFQEELQKGKDLLRHRRYDEALKSLKRANEMREKKCAACFGFMTEAYLGLEAYKSVIRAADKVFEFAAGDTQLIVKAYNNKGLALQAQAERGEQDKFHAAEAVFRQGLTLPGAQPVLRYNLGVTLLQQNRDPEGVAELKQYVKLQPKGPYVETARKLIDNPRRARENYAPDFSLTTSDGEHLTLEDLRGKVVVLDFWGTWCPPCVQSVPELRSLRRRYLNEPFMLIGISSDADEEIWRDFTSRNRMTWPQYRDHDRKLQNAFNVRAFPTYVVIDHEGIVRFLGVGAGPQRAATLDNAIRRQVARSSEER